jgi:glutamine phosphoribosylpyrophosphate amidotransferase
MHLISLSIKKNWDGSVEGLKKVFEEVTKKLDGSYSFVFLNGQGDLVICRDPLGIRPLVMVKMRA